MEFERKKWKKFAISKEWNSKEKNEFRKNVIRSIDLSRQNLGLSGFQNCPFCVKINYDNFYPILKLLYIIIFIKAAASFVAKVFPQSLFFHPYPQPTPFFSQKIAAAHSSLPFGFLRNGWRAIKRKRNDVSSSFPTNTKDKSTTWKIFSAKKKVEDVIWNSNKKSYLTGSYRQTTFS